MTSVTRTSGLPSRFPVGTKFVIEGRPGGNGRVFSRYLEFPDGTRVRLPKHGEKPKAASQRVERRPRGTRSNRRH
jgi:hypothetical protein